MMSKNQHRDRKLAGMVLTHVEDFNLAGDEMFVEDMIAEVKRELTVSKVENNQYTIVDIIKHEN